MFQLLIFAVSPWTQQPGEARNNLALCKHNFTPHMKLGKNQKVLSSIKFKGTPHKIMFTGVLIDSLLTRNIANIYSLFEKYQL